LTRKQIMAFLVDEQIPYRTDPTNLQDNTDRNFVRNRLIPVVRERFPDFAKPLKRGMDLIELEESLLQELTCQLYSQAVSKTDCGFSIEVSAMRSAHEAIAARVIVLALYEVSGAETRWQRSHVDAVMKMVRSANPSGEIHLPGGPIVYREYGRLVLSSKGPKSGTGFTITVTGPGAVHVPAAGMILQFRILTTEVIVSADLGSTTRALFDADQTLFPLTVRSPIAGERFRPWGMDGTRKLKKVLIDAKVPLRERKSLPLVVKGEEILWIPGLRRSRTAPVTPHTKNILEMVVLG
jgi:tRNA(Ile)-lysidine synthase